MQDPEQRRWLLNEIEKKCTDGAWNEVDESLAHMYCIVNAFVIPKARRPGQFRDVWDMRPVNRCLPRRPFKFGTLETVAHMIGKDWWFATLDLKDAYHHVGLDPYTSRFCAFRWLGRLIVSLVLSFGLSLTPWLFTKVMKVPITKWRSEGVLVVAYLDDLIVMAASKEQLLSHMEVVKRDLEALGLTVNWAKSRWEPQQRGEWLGVTIDTVKGVYEITTEQLSRLQRELATFISDTVEKGSRMSARQMAKLAGHIICWKRALPPAVLITRELFLCFKDVAGRWGTAVPVSEAALHDARWLLSNLDNWNGKSIWKDSRLQTVHVTTDASELFWAAKTVVAGRTLELRGPLPVGMRGLSSTLRELHAVRMCFEEVAPLLVGFTAQLRSDSQAAVANVTRAGAGSAEMWAEVRLIWEAALKHGFELSHPVWIPREDNTEVDSWTRAEADLGNWSVAQAAFDKAVRLWGPLEFDRFAMPSNTKCRAFSSRWFTRSATAIDAFAQDWAGPLNWLTPPLPIVGRCVQHLRACRAEGVLVFPRWVGQWWWPLLLPLLRGPVVELLESEIIDDPTCASEIKRGSWVMCMARVSGQPPPAQTLA